MEPVRKAARAAARLYLDAPKERTLTQCIAIGAKENGVEWKAVAKYLSGVGARAIFRDEGLDIDLLLRLVREICEPIASEWEPEMDYCTPAARITDLPAWVVWKAQDVMTLLAALPDEVIA